jgi:uncharacterized protein YndB with AHSA1/START domain
MMKAASEKAAARVEPFRVSRSFAAPRETVFKAWSSADHVRRWFTPEGLSTPHARVQMHVGGPFEVCMRAPDGTEHWVRGSFTEVSPPDRLVLDTRVEDATGHVLFHCLTEVDFVEALGGTRMDVVQTYRLDDPEAAWMVSGAPEGWRSTLDNLVREIARMRGEAEVKRSVVHATFRLERTYGASVDRVFSALSDEKAKSRWFGGTPGQWELLERHMDFRVGGTERLKGRWEGGVTSTFDACYHDIVPRERIVYSYEMHLDDKKISVSLATMELEALGPKRTRLKVTEQGAFLDGYDDAGMRERGTAMLLDRLGESVKD